LSQPVDPLQELRQALSGYGFEPSDPALEGRKLRVSRAAAKLKSVGDLRRALSLAEWRDNDDRINPKTAAIDREARTKIGQRLIEAIGAVVDKGDSAGRVAVAALIGEINASVRSLRPEDLSGFGRSLTPFLLTLMGNSDPEVRQAAARAVGKVNPRPE